MRYHYSIVRFVPYPIRGEFINVAIIAGSDESGEWAVRRVENPLHALRLGGDRDRLSAVWRYLDSVEGQITPSGGAQAGKAADMSVAWLEEEYGYHRNLIQLTSPVPVAAETVQEALNGMFELFVVDPEKAARHTRKAAINALRGAFLGADLPSSYLHERVTATVGPQQIPVDFAVANGHLVQLAHAWSFGGRRPQTTVQQVKAWSWTVRDLRDYGGIVRTHDGKHDYPVDRDVEIGVTYSEPRSDPGRRSLDEALDVFEHLHVRAVNIDHARTVAEDAVRALASGADS